MYSVLYRNSGGTFQTATVTAESESEARQVFSNKYDGRIITVTRW